MDQSSEKQSTYETMYRRGYTQICFAKPGNFGHIFQCLDLLSHDDSHADWREEISTQEREWLQSTGASEAYRFAPNIYSRRLSNRGALEKCYLQISERFYKHLISRKESVYYQDSEFAKLCDDLMIFSNAAADILIETLSQLGPIEGKQQSLAVLVKALTSEPSSKWSAAPHYDKSLLTLIVDADNLTSGNLRIAPFGADLAQCSSSMPSPSSFDDNKKCFGVVFPGMAMRTSGICDLPPSLHGVLPANHRRHSLIAFLLDLASDETEFDMPIGASREAK